MFYVLFQIPPLGILNLAENEKQKGYKFTEMRIYMKILCALGLKTMFYSFCSVANIVWRERLEGYN